MTGIVQAIPFRKQVADALARPSSAEKSPHLLVLDLENLKTVNASCGIETGEAVLKSVTTRIRRVVGSDAIVGQTGSDEFAVLLPNGENPTAVGERLLELVGRPYAIKGRAVTMSANIGSAAWPADGVDPDSLFESASMALRQAVAEGQNRQRAFEPSMQEQSRLRQALENDLRAALAFQHMEFRAAVALNQFVLHYQPIVDLVDLRVLKFEALIRWEHPTRGALGPDVFIPLAEEANLMCDLGRWVLRAATHAASAWNRLPLGVGVGVSLNIAPSQLRRGAHFVADIADALEREQLPPENLTLEITEKALIGEAQETMRSLRDLGVSLSIDDFGMGYSSLGTLSRFVFDELKIDASFVHALGGEGTELPADRRAARSSRAAWMIRAIASLGFGLGMPTVGEGVETHAQRNLLVEAGVTRMQGSLTSLAVPETEIPELLSRIAERRLLQKEDS